MIKGWLENDVAAINQLLHIAPGAIEEIYNNKEVAHKNKNGDVDFVNYKVLHQLLDKYEKEQPLIEISLKEQDPSNARTFRQ